MKKILSALFILLFASALYAIDLTPAEIVKNIKVNQQKVQDMSAKISTVIKSEKDKKSMEQKGLIIVKGKDKSRMEILSPIKQITITNGDSLTIINPETGKKIAYDLKVLRKKSGDPNLGKSPLDQGKLFDDLDLTVEEKGFFRKQYVLTGTAKKNNPFMGKVKFYVDQDKFVPTKFEVYGAGDKLVTVTELDHKQINDVWIMTKSHSKVDVPSGKIDIEVKLDDVKVNKGIDDSLFSIK